MSTPIRIVTTPTTSKVVGADRACKLELNRLLSYRVNGSEHMAAVQSGGWNGRSSFFHYDEGVFPTGFIHMVVAGLRKAGYQPQLQRHALPEPLGPEFPEVDSFGYEDRYDYQPEVMKQLQRHGQIIARVATGGGKSRIARMCMKRINRRTLFLTTRGVLMYQMHEALEKMEGESIAILGDGEWGVPYEKPDGTQGRRLSKFNVGMVQTLAACLKDPDPTKSPEECAAQKRRQAKALAVLEKFEFVILEEAHEVSSDQFWTIMAACKNAAYRLSLTATPFMKDDEEANMRLLGCSGPIAVDISEKLLIDRGILAKPYFKFITLTPEEQPKKLYRSSPFQHAYKLGIVHNDARNKKFVAEVTRAVRHGLSAMVLVLHKEHGAVLKELFTRVGVRSEFIFGDSNQKQRKATIARLAAGEIDVLIGSTILDVGVDVPAVGCIALAGGGKAEVAVRQRVGRGLREKRRGPNVALIIDAADSFNTHLRAHAKERREIIESTPGFAEGIVPDFDYRALGLEKAAA
jgi:superfamily II DNA or RNA helicase